MKYMGVSVLRLEGISKSFGKNQVLDNVNFSVGVGEVHALAGENGAGKSTLMNIISGLYRKDSGKMWLNGEEAEFQSPRESCIAGIGFVHQEMALCPDLSVAENVYMWNIPSKQGKINFKKLYKDTDMLLKMFDVEFTPKSNVGALNMAQQQVVEIMRALSMDAKLIILDEPTSSLTENETENLFSFIDMLKKKGISFIYISHRLPEIFSICDMVTVLRDGKMIDTLNVKEITAKDIVERMVGRTIENYYPEKSNDAGVEILEVRNISGQMFKDVSFTLKKGEILGFSGLVGAGRSEVMQAVCGLGHYTEGEVYIKGEKLNPKSRYYKLANKGIFYLTEDRKKNGLFLELSTRKNISVTVLDKIFKNGLLNSSKEKEISEEFIKLMNIKVSSDSNLAGSMSGGNQQKVMIAKWIAANPVVLILDEPTRGVDVGAKSEIHHKLRELCNLGIGIIVISSEMPEIIGICDRVIVMHEGTVTGCVSGGDITEVNLGMMASNLSKE